MKMFSRCLAPLLLLLLLGSHTTEVEAEDDELTALVGEDLILKCPISERCGRLHSVRWYKGEERIALLAEAANLAKAEGKMEKRIQVSLSSLGELKISAAELDDEGQYRCDLTYTEPIDSCKTVQSTKLRMLLKPKFVDIFDQNNKLVKSGSPLGGLLEGSETMLECKAIGGRPSPMLTWTIGDKEISGDLSTSGEDEESETVNRLVIKIERKLQGKHLKCSVTSEALSEPMAIDLTLDLILRPTEINISGVEHHVVQGSKVTLECLSKGARPPAVIMWMNDTQLVPADQTLTTSEIQKDGTYNTISRLSFWATRWEHNHSFSCESRQLAAPLEQNEIHLNASHMMDVHFPPVISVHPSNITVNESTDVLLFCEYISNPPSLIDVKWIKDDVELDVLSNNLHYEGGDLNQQTLLIKNTSEEDIGNYYCKLENLVGSTISPDFIYVDIQFKPEVILEMDVENPMIESLKQNVTLECTIVQGNPQNLLEVRWYLDGELLKQLPDCNYTDNESSDDMCLDIEPTRLLLEEVARSFHGNYSCQGKNAAGWGQRSNDTELIVLYEPGPTTLTLVPKRVIKGGSITLTCSVEDYGRPTATRFQWFRGKQLITDIVTSEWMINPVTLETETNFSCSAVNDAGTGIAAILPVDVEAPPAFITELIPTTGILFNASDVFLICRIECSPLCGIVWTKNGKVIETTDSDQDLYSINNEILPPDLNTMSFESINSQLVFNMSNWPNQVLDRLSDNANYSCSSEENGIGPVVSSFTSLSVEYPPENMSVSNKVVSVIEDHIPGKIICSAKGKPAPKFRWLKYNSTHNSEENDRKPDPTEILSTENVLKLKRGVSRSESGDLICEAYNIHGALQISTYLNVMFKPECTISRAEVDDEKVLICKVIANPTEVDFSWSFQDENDTILEDAIVNRGVQSILKIEQITLNENPRTVICVSNNTIGSSLPCTFVVRGILPWWKWWSRTALIVAAGIAALLLLVIILCLIILCICRRKRAASKLDTPTPLDEQESSAVANESSIVQAIVSQSIPNIIKTQQSTSPVYYSDRSKLVPNQTNIINPQNKNIQSNKNPLALNVQNSGRLQADLCLLEASYQASLLANKRKCSPPIASNENIHASQNATFENEKQNVSIRSLNCQKQKETDDSKETKEITNTNCNDTENENNSKLTETQGLKINKWPLKPGVLVHVNSNHSLSPKKIDRNSNTITVNEINIQKEMSEEENMLIDPKDKIIDDKNNSDNNTNKETNSETNKECKSLDMSKYKNITKTETENRISKFSRIFKRIDMITSNAKYKSEDKKEPLKTNRSKSNKMALSLAGFVLKDENTGKGKGLKSIFRSQSPIMTQEVVSFRRPVVTTNNQNDIPEPNNPLTNKSLNSGTNDNPDDSNSSTHSKSSSYSRKRKKPGEAPANGGAENGTRGVDNPGLYENLPFHGLQQAPNKPIQIIQPRIVKTTTDNNLKSPEAILNKQLQSNPSFTPRILSCPPFLHNSNYGLNKNNNGKTLFTLPNNQTIAMNQLYTNRTTAVPSWQSKSFEKCNQDQIFNISSANYNSHLNNNEDKKFYSLNMRKERVKKYEPRFSSMKIVRKRKLDRFYPNRNRIDYVIIDKNMKNLTNKGEKIKEVIYANYPCISTDTMNVEENSLKKHKKHTFQNLTDSIQIHENSSLNSSYNSNGENKVPTPAPRFHKSMSTLNIENKSLNYEHVYANISNQIKNSKLNNDLMNALKKEKATENIPKTLPRSLKIDMNGIQHSNKNPNFTSLTFPKRTTKSGKLMDTNEDHTLNETKKHLVVSKGKVVSSRSPSRNHSFSEGSLQNDKHEYLPHKNNIFDKLKMFEIEQQKTSPSIVNATPKVKPFNTATSSDKQKFNKLALELESHINNQLTSKLPVSEDKQQSENKFFVHTKPNELEKATNIVETKINKLETSENKKGDNKDASMIKQTTNEKKNVGKVLPKQNLLIKPSAAPLQIPNLVVKPIPKIQPTQLKRSQSSLSGKGISSELLQQYRGASGLQDGSLVKAKIRELNLRQPFKPDINDQFIYADADLKDYGPINYKQASIYARMKKIKEQQKMEIARRDDD